MTRRRLLALVAPFALSACVLGPNHEPPSVENVAYSELVTSSGELIAYGEPVDRDWWRSLGDPTLERLVEEAREANPDLRQAVARVDQANAGLLAARARFLPVVSAEAEARRVNASEVAGAFGPPPGLPEEQDFFRTQGLLSWELDVFGGVRRRTQVAGARAEAAAFQRRDVMLSVTGRVAQEYARLVTLRAQLNAAEANRDAAAKTLVLTERLLEAELGDRQVFLQARSDLRSQEAQLPPLRAQRHAAAARLAILLGRQPGPAIEELIDLADGPLVAGTIPAGLPSDLLRRRPDIRAAERRLAAEVSGIGAEVADLFPSFSLTAAYGSEALATDLLFQSASEAWSYGGLIRVPIFDLARQRADVDRAEAEAAEALAAYDGAVLQALAEVEQTLSAYQAATARLADLSAATADQAEAVRLVEMTFTRGLSSGIDVLEAQRRLFALRSRTAAAQGELFASLIDAQLALGGGFEAAGRTEASLAMGSASGSTNGRGDEDGRR